MSDLPSAFKILTPPVVGLASNTRNTLQNDSKLRKGTIRCEYHFASGRELYDRRVVSADRYSSGAARLALNLPPDLYRVVVVSQRVRRPPQTLCVSFDCIEHGGPESVALQFLSLLSVFAREPLVPLGVRRLASDPVVWEPQYKQLTPHTQRVHRPPTALDSYDMKTILKGIAESADEDVDSALAASRFYQAGLSFLQFDRSMAYVSLVSAVECLAGRYFRTQTLSFDEVKHQFQEFDPLFQDLSTMPSASDQLKQLLIKNVYRLRQRFVSFIEKHLPEEFWVISDSDYDDSARQLVPKIGRQELQGRLKDAYDARSRYVHAGEPLPAYVEIGTAEGVSLAAFSQLGELGVLPEGEHYAPTLMWLERVVNLVLLEYIRRTFATELQIRIEKQLRKHRTLLERITKLPQEAQNSLVKLTKWTTRWLGFAVIGPHLPNKDWADNPQSVRALREAGLIAVNGSDADGSSGLRDRRVGEAAGEFVFGPADNPLRDSELLMPEGFEATDSTE